MSPEELKALGARNKEIYEAKNKKIHEAKNKDNQSHGMQNKKIQLNQEKLQDIPKKISDTALKAAILSDPEWLRVEKEIGFYDL